MDWDYWLPYWFNWGMDVLGTIVAGWILFRVFGIGAPPKVIDTAKLAMYNISNVIGRIV